jgi:hypothetical protein
MQQARKFFTILSGVRVKKCSISKQNKLALSRLPIIDRLGEQLKISFI